MRTDGEKKGERGKGSAVAALSVMSALAAVGFVFAALCALRFNEGFFLRYRVYVAVALFTVVFLAVTLEFCFYFAKKEVWYKLAVSALFLIDLALAVFYVLLATGFLTAVDSAESFKEYLLSAGAWMDALFIALQFLQVIILPLPSFVTLVAGTALFGAVRCFLYSYFSIAAGSVTAFFIGRFLGYRAVCWMVGKDTLDEWLKKMKGKDNLILTAMFVLPLFPDDILCFVAGLSSMTAVYFVGMTLVARAISVASTCFLANALPFTTWWGILAWAAVWAAEFALFLLFRKNQDRLQRWLRRRRKKRRAVRNTRNENSL